MEFKLFLPTSDIQIRIPLLKFTTDFNSKNIPFGRGVLPNHHIEPTFTEFVNGTNSQLEYEIKQIKNK